MPGQDVRSRLVRAASECVARWGLAKTTVEDAAREAGISRATVYRYFPGGRDELFGAVVARETDRFLGRLYAAVRGAGTLESVLEAGLAFAHRDVREHRVLQRVLETEPDVLLPKLTVEGADAQQRIAAFLEPYLTSQVVAPGIAPHDAAQFLARMALSYISSPGRWDLDDPADAARLVRAQLLGAILPPRRRPATATR
jgi:AcrR family transcriptional regulator